MSTGRMKKDLSFWFFRELLKLLWVGGIFFTSFCAIDVKKVLKLLAISFSFVVRTLSIRRLYLLLALVFFTFSMDLIYTTPLFCCFQKKIDRNFLYRHKLRRQFGFCKFYTFHVIVSKVWFFCLAKSFIYVISDFH